MNKPSLTQHITTLIFITIVAIVLAFLLQPDTVPPADTFAIERDSLQTMVLNAKMEADLYKTHVDSLVSIGFHYASLTDSLRIVIVRQDNEIIRTKEELLTYNLPVDSLIADLNAILAGLFTTNDSLSNLISPWGHISGSTEGDGYPLPESILQIYTATPFAVGNTGQCIKIDGSGISIREGCSHPDEPGTQR